MMIKLTKNQKQGLKISLERYKKGEKYTCIAGYAGTGKSTLVSYLIKELGLRDEEIAYCCYTGKASLVLSQKGCPATTAHRLVYRSRELPNGTFIHYPRECPENPLLKLVVVDEVSMLEVEMWDILMSWDVHVICLGDPEQLPPLHSSNKILDNPHVFLDEIMRQEEGSEIIDLSMKIRELNSCYPLGYKGKEVSIISKRDLTQDILLNVDQVICGKNVTRRNLNSFMRSAIYGDKYSELPLDNDKIICLKNYCEFDLVNGEIGNIIKPKIVKDRCIKSEVVEAGFETGYSSYHKLKMDKQLFETGESCIDEKMRRRLEKCDRPLEFDYGYAITCHKAQGSQWDSILIYDEYLGDKENHRKWLYTAVTRACKKLIICK